MSLYKNCGRLKNFDCIFEFSVKSYVRNTINLSCAKILFPSVISDYWLVGYVQVTNVTTSFAWWTWETALKFLVCINNDPPDITKVHLKNTSLFISLQWKHNLQLFRVYLFNLCNNLFFKLLKILTTLQAQFALPYPSTSTVNTRLSTKPFCFSWSLSLFQQIFLFNFVILQIMCVFPL